MRPETNVCILTTSPLLLYSYNMATEFRVLLLYPNLHMMLVPSTAIALFTKVLKDEAITVDLFDTTHYFHNETTSAEKRVETLQYRPFDPENDLSFKKISGDKLIPDFLQKIRLFKPHLIIVSIVEDTFKQAIMLLDHIKDQNIPTLMGGVFVTAAPEKVISYESVKMIGLGEGENVVKNVSCSLRDNLPLNNIQNLWFKNNDGMVVRNKIGPLIDLNKPMPDYSLFEEKRFMRPMGGRVFKTLPLESYRGCPFQCAFCNSPMQVAFAQNNELGNFLRRKKINKLRDEIRYLIDTHQPEYFYFVDDSFLSRPRSEIDEFVKMYSEFKIPFWFNTRPESISPDTLSMLKSVGLDRLSVGLEHGNEEFRQKVLLRRPSNKALLKHFETLAHAGIAFSINNIIGFPDETRELVFETIEFNRQLSGFDALTVSIFTPYHGTALRKEAINKGYLDENTFTTHTTSSSLLTMPQLTSEQIDGMFRTFLMYVRFEKALWKDIQRAEKLDSEGNKMWNALFSLYQERFYKTDQEGHKLTEHISIQNNVTIKHPKGDHWEEVFGSMSKTQMR